MAERVEARLRIGAIAGQHAEHDARRPEHDRQRPGRVDADAECAGGLVARAADLGRLVRARQPLARDLERVEHLVAPPPVPDVEEERPGRVGRVDRELALELQADVVLRQQDVADPAVDVRLVPAEPEELRRGEARERAVARQLDQPVEPDALLDLGALRARALVVPEDRRPQHFEAAVERDEAVHLARQPDRPLGEPREHGLRRAPPVGGILLGPPGSRRRERVLLLRDREDVAARRHRHALDAGRADVDPDQDVLHAPPARGGGEAAAFALWRLRQAYAAPSAAYTSSYAFTASLSACAARSACSSIFAATPSMKFHCSTDRRTASTASSVYG